MSHIFLYCCYKWPDYLIYIRKPCREDMSKINHSCAVEVLLHYDMFQGQFNVLKRYWVIGIQIKVFYFIAIR